MPLRRRVLQRFWRCRWLDGALRRGPGRAPGIGAGITGGQRWAGRGSRPRRLGWRGISLPVGGGPVRCLSAGGRTARAAAAGPFPCTRRLRGHSPSRTPADRACLSGPAVLPAPSDPVAAKARRQGHSLRSRPSVSLRANP